mgnify:FL=1|tara:strand:+ start:2528 stop:2728 length:201 start_codon:yes stop_codon:yes gene_type:complete
MIDELNEAKDNKNKIVDELIVLLKKNVAKKKIYKKELELQDAEQELINVKKKRISWLKRVIYCIGD